MSRKQLHGRRKVLKSVAGSIGLAGLGSSVVAGAPTNKDPDDLVKKIYKDYGITENDIKFAKGELPYFLEGTILDGSRTVVTAPAEERNKITSSNVVTITPQQRKILSDVFARRFIEKYGVNPLQRKLQWMEGRLLPREFVGKKLQNALAQAAGRQDLTQSLNTSEDYSALFDPSPLGAAEMIKRGIGASEDRSDVFQRTIDGYQSPVVKSFSNKKIRLCVWLHGSNTPQNDVVPYVEEAARYFESTIQIDEVVPVYIDGEWSGGSNYDNSRYLESLKNHTPNSSVPYADDYYNVHIGMAEKLKRNGLADVNTWWCTGAMRPKKDGEATWDWPNDNLIIHEVMHCFNCGHHKCYWAEKCPMDYANSAFGGSLSEGYICSEHKTVLNDNVQTHHSDNYSPKTKLCI